MKKAAGNREWGVGNRERAKSWRQGDSSCAEPDRKVGIGAGDAIRHGSTAKAQTTTGPGSGRPGRGISGQGRILLTASGLVW